MLFGGFLFGMEGDESNQIDLIITNNQSPQFNFYNPDGAGKSFACIDGSVAIAALKSNLTSSELRDALRNISSIPNKRSIEGKVNPLIKLPYIEDWPYKIIYATDGINPETAWETIEEFYQDNSNIPTIKRPNIVHVAGKYVLIRARKNEKTRDGKIIPENAFNCTRDTTDVFGLMWTIFNIQRIALSQSHILYSYIEIIDRIDF